MSDIEEILRAALRDVPAAPGREAIRHRLVEEGGTSRTRGRRVAVAASILVCAVTLMAILRPPAGPASPFLSRQDPAALIEGLGADDPAVRERSEEELIRRGPAARDLVRAALDSPNLEIQARARRVLAAIEWRDALPPDAAAAFSAASGGMARLGILAGQKSHLARMDPAAQKRLMEAAFDAMPWASAYDDGTHQAQLFELRDLLVKGGLPGASWFFERMISHPDAYVRLHGLIGLEETGARPQGETLKARLDDPDARVRLAAARALARIGRSEGLADVERAWAGGAEPFRRDYLEALDEVRSPWLRRFALLGLEDGSRSVRAMAVGLLHMQRDLDTVGPLEKALQGERDPHLRFRIESALQTLRRVRGRVRDVPFRIHSSGDDSGCHRRAIHRVRDAEAWKAVWDAHRPGTEPPAVDFASEEVLAFFEGDQINCSHVSILSVQEDSASVYVRFNVAGFQSRGDGIPTVPFGIVVIPRTDKPAFLEEGSRAIMGGPWEWDPPLRLEAGQSREHRR